MSKHLQRDLENLKRDILIMGSMVEISTNKAILALVQRKSELAEEVIQGDHKINNKENKIEITV